jgi:hypothetical protein
MGGFFKKAVIDGKESATVQHEVYKAEAKASFEENRGCNTFAKASHVSVNTFRALFQKQFGSSAVLLFTQIHNKDKGQIWKQFMYCYFWQ